MVTLRSIIPLIVLFSSSLFSQGQLEKVIIKTFDNETKKVARVSVNKFFYDAKNNQVELYEIEDTLNQRSMDEEKTRWEYNDKGQITQQVLYDESNSDNYNELKAFEQEHYSYDDFGRLLNVTRLKQDGGELRKTSKSEYLYDEDGNVIEIKTFHFQENKYVLSSKFIQHYEAGKLRKNEDYLLNESNEEFRLVGSLEFEYDSKNRITKTKFIDQFLPDYINISIESFIYNNDDLIIKSERFRTEDEKKIRISSIDYLYDNHGNVIEMVEVTDDYGFDQTLKTTFRYDHNFKRMFKDIDVSKDAMNWPKLNPLLDMQSRLISKTVSFFNSNADAFDSPAKIYTYQYSK